MNRNQIKFILTSVCGNILEWYDFVLYGYFATIFAKLFFPTSNAFLSLMITFSVFATGFLARPFGGIVFGHLGDKHGRKIALLISIALILIPTTAIGLLPTYRTIGLAAPILLTLFRLLQGLAVSGEQTGAGIFLIECASKEKKGFYGSLIICSAFVGMLLASGVCAIVLLSFSQAQIEGYAWRIPFLVSFVLGVAALMLRLQCEESPLFTKLKADNKTLRVPIFEAAKKFPWQLLNMFLLISTEAAMVYMMVGYFPSYFLAHKFVTFQGSMEIISTGLFVLGVLTLLMGLLSDRIGYKKVVGLGILSALVLSYPIFDFASRFTFQSAMISVLLIAICMGPISGGVLTLVVEALPVNIRYSGVSLCWNMSMSLFGGTVPLVAMAITKATGSELAPALYLSLSSVLAFIALVCLKFEESKDESYSAIPAFSPEA